jgi:hypothetical protein
MRMREEKRGVVMRVRAVYHGAVRMRRETRGCDEGESSVSRGCENEKRNTGL